MSFSFKILERRFLECKMSFTLENAILRYVFEISKFLMFVIFSQKLNVDRKNEFFEEKCHVPRLPQQTRHLYWFWKKFIFRFLWKKVNSHRPKFGTYSKTWFFNHLLRQICTNLVRKSFQIVNCLERTFCLDNWEEKNHRRWLDNFPSIFENA